MLAKKRTIIGAYVAGVLCLIAWVSPSRSYDDVPYIHLLLAIERVESGGLTTAISKSGAVGCLQIKPIVIDDVNRITGGVNFTLQDAFSRERSAEIFMIYTTYYAHPSRIGRNPTAEDVARIWNGGPNGWKKSSTKAYWNRVRAEIDKLQ